MAYINIEVWDLTGKRGVVEVPNDVPVNRILVVLIEKLNMPRYSPDRQLLSYKFHHQATKRQLLDDQTLNDGGVRNGDVVHLQPEITAGSNYGR